MAIIILHFRDFYPADGSRPAKCPYCNSQVLQGWGRGVKVIQDVGRKVGEYHRYRCCSCGRTFRQYAHGIDKTRLTERIRKVAALAWGLGLSARDVVAIFKKFGVELGYMTVWRDGHKLLKRCRAAKNANQPDRNRINRLVLENDGYGKGTIIVVDTGNERTVVLGMMYMLDYREVLELMEPFLKDLGIWAKILQTGALPELIYETE